MGRIILALLLLVGSAQRARAESDPKTERARIHLKAAIAYYDEARYEDAAREMESAYALKPLPDLQYNLAQCYERLGRYTDAAAAYATYLKANSAAPDRKLVETRDQLIMACDLGRRLLPYEYNNTTWFEHRPLDLFKRPKALLVCCHL